MQAGAVPNAIKRSGTHKFMEFRPFTTNIANYEKFHQYDRDDSMPRYRLPDALTAAAVAALPGCDSSSHAMLDASTQSFSISSRINKNDQDNNGERQK